MVSVTEMARPKSEDPTVAVPIRIKQSAADWWTKVANKEKRTLPKQIQHVLEERAAKS